MGGQFESNFNENMKDKNTLVEENNKLKEQVEILERFPPGAGDSDTELVKELQVTRLSVARLENENNNLNEVVSILKNKIENEFQSSDEMTVFKKEKSKIVNELNEKVDQN